MRKFQKNHQHGIYYSIALFTTQDFERPIYHPRNKKKVVINRIIIPALLTSPPLTTVALIAFGFATRCHLCVHSLAMPRSGPVDGSHGGGEIGRASCRERV